MNKQLPQTTFFLMLLIALSPVLSAQSLPAEKQQRIQEQLRDKHILRYDISPERHTPAMIELDQHGPQAYRQQDVPQLLQRYLGLRPATDELRMLKKEQHVDQIEFTRYQQYYKGIKVEHGQYVALSKAAQPTHLSGAYFTIETDLPTQPALSEAQALKRALSSINADQYVWEYIDQYRNGINAPDIAARLREAYQTYFPKGELVIVDDYNTPELDLDLAYKFNIYASEPLSRDWVYVNAHDGRIMLTNPIIKHAKANVQTRYNGIQEIVTTAVAGPNPSPDYIGDSDYFVLWDQSRGNGIRTLDMNGIGGLPLSVSILYDLAEDFIDDDNNWTLAEHVRNPPPTVEEAVNDDIAWDAHWGAAMVYDYWKERHNRLSFDGNDAAINSYVHYGEGYDNAFWNGSAMTYGDGSYKNTGAVERGSFSPLTSMDVCAHEIGHGVCEFTADLVYRRESGAMNEGFSDIWAAAIETYVMERYASQQFDYRVWGIGEQIDQRSGFNNLDKALRWMDDPKRAGDPDTYGGANWVNPECGEPTLANDYCGVHTNSGVLNKWYYLLTVGSGQSPDDGVNDNGDAYQVNGVGFVKSERIAFGTEVMLTPTATFAEARAASIAYTRATYGPCSAEEEAVTNAWFAVGVGPAFVCQVELTTGFLITEAAVNESVMDDAGCGATKVITTDLFFNTDASFTLEVGGTATQGIDYVIDNTNINITTSGFATHTVHITVIDDAAEEGTETITLTIPAGNDSAEGSDVYTLTIRDDDVEPIVGIGQKSLLYERFLSTQMPEGWGVVTTIGSLNQWFFGSYEGSAYISVTGELPYYEGNNNPTDIILRTPLIDARGLTGITVSFDWTAGGETDIALSSAAPFDYANLVYSFDGQTFYDLEDVFVGENFGATPRSGNLIRDLSELLANQEFYLGWRWQNDPLLGTAYSFALDNVRINAQTRRVESDLDHSAEAELGPFATVYLYSLDDGELMAKVTNNSSHDYGCTGLSIERAGEGATAWYNGQATDKAFRLTPENATNATDLDISLYLTEEEISGWENATGLDRQALQLYATSAATIGQATAKNSNTSTTTYTPIFKSATTRIAGNFSATLQGEIGGLVLAAPTAQNRVGGLPATATSVDIRQWSVYPNPTHGPVTIQLPELQKEGPVYFQLMDVQGRMLQQRTLGAADGRFTIDTSELPTGLYLIKVSIDDITFSEKLLVR